jgi:hypothetical protein
VTHLRLVGSGSDPGKSVHMLLITTVVRTALGPIQQVPQAHYFDGSYWSFTSLNAFMV